MKPLSLLIITLFCTIGAKAQPWIGTVPGNIYYNQGNVGIGTTNPGIKLTTKSNYTPGTYYSAINSLPSDGSAGGLYLGSIQTDNAIIGSGGTYNDAGKWMSKSTSLSAISLNNGSISFIVQAGLSPNTEFVPTTSMTIASSGNVGIGTTAPEAKLTVKGKIVASEVQVKDIGNIPDYVFKPDYELMPLSDVEEFVKQNQHLPEVPSEKEFKENGMNMAEMNALLLKKIEELTLYSIEQNKKAEEFRLNLIEQNKKSMDQAKKIESLEKAMNILISK